jgi:hypothetical protein
MSAMDFIADLFRGWEKGDSAPFFAALAEAANFLCSPRRTHRWLPARAPEPIGKPAMLELAEEVGLSVFARQVLGRTVVHVVRPL